MWKELKKRFGDTDSFISLVLGLAVVVVVGMTIVNYVRNLNGKAASIQQQQTVATQSAAAPGKTYEVRTGDTLWTIAENVYKSGYSWTAIAQANKLSDPGTIEVGQKLMLPEVTPVMGQATAASTESKPKQKSYTVMAGDDLWDIAVRQYQDGYKWVEIAKANKLENPGLIHPGNVLILP